MSTALVWFRRDLRLADHPALLAALAQHERVIPVYIHAADEEGEWAPGAASRWWLHHALSALAHELRSRGSALVIRRGSSLDALLQLVRESGAEAVYWHRLYEPTVIERDKAVKAALREHGLDARSFNGALLAEPWTVAKADGGPYRVFTAFWRALPRHAIGAPEPAPDDLPAHPVAGEPLDALALLPRIAWDSGMRQSWRPGEVGALALLRDFVSERVERYTAERDLPARQATSRLSAPLHFGEVSPRPVIAALRLQAPDAGADFAAGGEHYERELGWREFAHHLLFHFPQTAGAPLDPRFSAFAWRASSQYAADLRAWQRGETGIPIVDAGMRELWHTGFMHNRVRMIVASLLTKNLLVPWQEGARWFWDTLVDADLANNTLGWQWTAGCGADAAPYFRVFNPVLQSRKFDPDGIYLKRWLPELAGLQGEALHAPWMSRLPPADYARPIVDLAQSRQRALEAWGRLRSA